MTLPPEDRDLIERVAGPLLLQAEQAIMEWATLARVIRIAREEGEDALRKAIKAQWRGDDTCRRLDDVRAHIAGLRPGDAEAIALFQQEFAAMKEAAAPSPGGDHE